MSDEVLFVPAFSLNKGSVSILPSFLVLVNEEETKQTFETLTEHFYQGQMKSTIPTYFGKFSSCDDRVNRFVQVSL